MESKFKGSVLDFFVNCIIVSLMCTFTLGIATPWAVCRMMNWVCTNSTISGKQAKFNGKGGQLFGLFIKWWLLTLITFGIYGLWASRNMIKWVIENTETV